MDMKLLVIIVTYNAMKWVEKCFDSLHSSSIVPDVFVVDNGSTDGTQAYIQENYPEVIFQQSSDNLGFGKANNMGLQYALNNDYDYVYLLNQDAWVLPDTFEKLIEISKNNSEYGILSPFQMNSDMGHVDRDFVKDVCRWQSNPDIFSDIYTRSEAVIYPVFSVMAAHWLITKECLQKVGGFSPSFHHYGEDNNYTDRVKFWGMKVGVVPSLRVVHDRGYRIDPPDKRMYFMYTTGVFKLSSPDSKEWLDLLRMFDSFLKATISYKSFKPLSYFFKICKNFRSIRRNKIISKENKCAFLQSFS